MERRQGKLEENGVRREELKVKKGRQERRKGGTEGES